MVTTSLRDTAFPRLGANKTAHRVASPAVVIGLGSTGCQIARRLEEVSSGWSFPDRKSLGFLYMDTREATRGEISRSARFIPLTLPHFSNLRDMRPWITECVPELKHLSLSREGALGTLGNAGVAPGSTTAISEAMSTRLSNRFAPTTRELLISEFTWSVSWAVVP